MAKLISKTYGEALFELALEENKTDVLLEEVQELQEVLLVNPELTELFLNPKLTRAEKEEALVEIFTGRISPELIGMFRLVLQKGRFRELDRIFTYFIQRVKAYQKIGVAEVTTAIPLSDVQKEAVQERLLQTAGFDTMEMRYQVDEDLVGGMVIRIGDRVVDSSIRTKLENMQRELMKIQLIS